MTVYDLHSHSTRSDGLLAPAAVAERAAGRGVGVLALTDHDDMSGLAEARAAAEAAGMRFVNGVEISVTWRELTLHVVGLAVDPQCPALIAGLEGVRGGRAQRAEDMAASLAEAGISGALEGAREHVTNPALVGRAHFARYLAARGYARDFNSVFHHYLTAGKPGYVPHQWAELGAAIEWINASGGIAVLAHPGRYRLRKAEREELLGLFKDAGGRAVEVVTGSHTPEQRIAWASYAQHFGLHASVGSDFHSPEESLRDLGALPPLPEGCRPVWELF